MARDHGRILTTIWQDRDFRKLTARQQRLYVLLLSQPDINNAGMLPMRLTKWAKFCVDIDHTHLLYDLHELEQHRFVFYDDETEEVLIRSFIRNDGILKIPNVAKNAIRCARLVESSKLREVLADELSRIDRKDTRAAAEEMKTETRSEPVWNTSEYVNDDVRNPSETCLNGLNPFETRSEPCGEGEGEGEGESLVGTYVGRDEKPPPQKFCSKHPDGTDAPCHACGQARAAREEWEQDQLAVTVQRRAAFREEVFDCPDCDDQGWVDTEDAVTRCTQHDWPVDA